MADAPALFAPGTRLGDGGRYELRRRIGVGGMAEVYKAIDTRLGDRVVAIKTLAASIAAHPCADKIRRLFIQEAQALSRVNDENVVDVLDFGVMDDQTPYMAMEFLQGEDLGALLKRITRMEIADAVDVMLGVCAGVHACHMAGIIHRDLKPANIFLAATLKGRQPKVLDFSVAKVLGPEEDRADKTRTELIVGTPSYMSPEQALGQPANELSDQYSIGALLYRTLTGRPPRGVSPKARDLRPEVPGDLEDTILRAIDPTPGNRFANVHELGQRLMGHTSPAGRDRWKTYYQAAPKPLIPNLTGSIIVDEGDQPPEGHPTATTTAEPYDFGVHDRTTRLDAPKAEAGDDTTGSTIPDPPQAEPHSETRTSLSPSTVAVAPPPIPPSRERSESEFSRERTPPRARTALMPSRAPARGKLVATFGSVAAVIVAITTAGAIHLRGRSDRSDRPLAPAVLSPPFPKPIVSPPIRPPDLPPPSATADATLVTGPAPDAKESPKSPPAPIHRTAPHRSRRVPHRTPPDDPTVVSPVPYGPDGMPILN